MLTTARREELIRLHRRAIMLAKRYRLYSAGSLPRPWAPVDDSNRGIVRSASVRHLASAGRLRQRLRLLSAPR